MFNQPRAQDLRASCELFHRLARGAVIAALAAGLAGCGGLFAQPTHTPTSTPTPTPAPTSTPAPLPTAEPTEPPECAAPGGCAVFGPGDSIGLGAAGPMTGDNSAFGIDELQAVQLAVTDAGPIAGFPITVIQGDDLGTGDGGASVAGVFTANPRLVAVVGHSFSGASSAAMPFYAQKLIPMMSGSATRPDLTQQDSPVFNRLVSTTVGDGLAAADFLSKSLGAKSVAVIYDGTPYGATLADSLMRNLKADGASVVALEMIDEGQSDYNDVLRKVARLKPDAVFFAGYQPEAATLAHGRAGAGLTVPFMSGDGVFGQQFLDLARSDGEGYYVLSAGTPVTDASKKIGAEYKKAYAKEAGELSIYTFFYYDAAMVLIQAIDQVAIPVGDRLYIPRKALVDAVRHTRGYQGLSGVVTCDDHGECASAPTDVVFQVQDGRFVQLPPDYKP